MTKSERAAYMREYRKKRPQKRYGRPEKEPERPVMDLTFVNEWMRVWNGYTRSTTN